MVFQTLKDKDIKFNLLNVHLFFLFLILLNFGFEIVTGYRIFQNLTFIFKTIVYLSGMLLFFKTLKPFKLISLYFSFYTISGVLIGLFFLFGGIFLALVSSILLYTIYPKQTVYKTETIKIYSRFGGFMGSCCSYEVVEPKLYVFEKYLGFINLENPIDTDKGELRLYNNTIIYKHKIWNYYDDKPTNNKKDTTEVLNLEQ